MGDGADFRWFCRGTACRARSAIASGESRAKRHGRRLLGNRGSAASSFAGHDISCPYEDKPEELCSAGILLALLNLGGRAQNRRQGAGATNRCRRAIGMDGQPVRKHVRRAWHAMPLPRKNHRTRTIGMDGLLVAKDVCRALRAAPLRRQDVAGDYCCGGASAGASAGGASADGAGAAGAGRSVKVTPCCAFSSTVRWRSS